MRARFPSHAAAGGKRAGAARRPDSGALILGYVIIVPAFLLAMMVVTQAALWYLARSAALAAARQGVDAARVMHSTPAAGRSAARDFAQRSASGYLLGPSASTAGSTGTTIKITVSGHAPSLVPGLPIRISQVAEGPVERFTEP
jgi:Flp pilus assembly protein TadG